MNYFNIKVKKQIIHTGPLVTNIEHLTRFKKKHKKGGQKCYIKSGRAYCKEKIKITNKKLVNDLKNKDKRILKEMGIKGICLLR